MDRASSLSSNGTIGSTKRTLVAVSVYSNAVPGTGTTANLESASSPSTAPLPPFLDFCWRFSHPLAPTIHFCVSRHVWACFDGVRFLHRLKTTWLFSVLFFVCCTFISHVFTCSRMDIEAQSEKPRTGNRRSVSGSAHMIEIYRDKKGRKVTTPKERLLIATKVLQNQLNQGHRVFCSNLQQNTKAACRVYMHFMLNYGV